MKRPPDYQGLATKLLRERAERRGLRHAADSITDGMGTDSAALRQLVADWRDDIRDPTFAKRAELRRRQQAHGASSSGPKAKVPPSKLADAVRAYHVKHPDMKFNSVCENVRKDKRWNGMYKSAWSIKQAAKDAGVWVAGSWFDE